MGPYDLFDHTCHLVHVDNFNSIDHSHDPYGQSLVVKPSLTRDITMDNLLISYMHHAYACFIEHAWTLTNL